MKHEDYKELAERMEADAFHRGCALSVLVEDIYDQRFWECLIEHVKPDLKDKIDFPNPTPKGTRGKNILKQYQNFVKKNFIICVDSDCEYLYDNNVWYLADYIYHTNVYSKENFQCHHGALNDISKDLTTKSYDFVSLLENISLKVAPLFYVWLCVKENNWSQFNKLINNETFDQILSFEGTQFDNLGDENLLYLRLEDSVNDILKLFKNEMGESWYDSTFAHDIPEIKTRLIEQYSIHENEILLFCYGHAVLEQLIHPFMLKIIEILKNLKIKEVKKTLSGASKGVIDNTTKRIENLAQQDIKTKLNDSFKYLIYSTVDNKQMQKIKEKLTSELNLQASLSKSNHFA